MPVKTDLQETLREAGLRVTRPRVAVLDAVYAEPHADTDTILQSARRDLPGVSHQAVYDVLRALTGAGLAQVRWPGRLESFTLGGCRVVIDAAHNAAGARALAAHLLAMAPSGVTLVFGALQDKQITEMLSALAPLLAAERPDVVLVYGDTNSTLAGGDGGCGAHGGSWSARVPRR